MTQPSRKSTFSFAPVERTPAQRAINALINSHQSARKEEDDVEQARIEQILPDALDHFAETRADGHSNPDWVIPTLRGNVAGIVFGDYQRAITLQKEGLTHAVNEWQRAIAFHNLSEYARNAGKSDEAVVYAHQAYKLWPENDATAVNLILALNKVGDTATIRRIASELNDSWSQDRSPDVAEAHLRWEAELKDVDVPEVRALFRRLK